MKSTIADFPDWFGPMLVKELRQGLKTKGFVISFIGLQLVLILVLIYHVLLYSRNVKDFDASDLGVIFWLLIGGLLIVVTPMRAFNELASERKANTLELIFMSGLSAWGITFGKWISLLFQSFLFVLAVLPYAILRYYFGGVELASDLTYMLLVLLACAVLSALALAVSGLPLWSRVLAGALAGFVVLSTLTGIVPMYFLRRSMGGVGGAFYGGPSFDEFNWWLVSWDVLVVAFIALQIGAAAIAPLAENHAGSQRFLALLLWAPVPLMRAMGKTGDVIFVQVLIFAIIAGLICWYHLSTVPDPLRSHCVPFAGKRAIFGVLFQPGWPSAVLFVILQVVLVQGTIYRSLPSIATARYRMLAISSMSSAALLCAAFVWVAFRRRARHPLVEQTLFLILCGVLVAMIEAGVRHGADLGQAYAFGIVPPMAFWVMADDLSSYGDEWNASGTLALAVYALLLILMSRRYWISYFKLCHAIAAPKPAAELAPSAP